MGRVVLSNRERPIMLEPMGLGLRGITLRYRHEIRSEARGEAGDRHTSPRCWSSGWSRNLTTTPFFFSPCTVVRRWQSPGWAAGQS
jgi:hypothetical protein